MLYDVVKTHIVAIVIAHGCGVSMVLVRDPKLGDGTAALIVGRVVGISCHGILDLFLIPEQPYLLFLGQRFVLLCHCGSLLMRRS